MSNPSGQHGQCTLGLDMGTTSIKAIAFSGTQEIARAAVPTRTLHQTDGTAEQDPHAITDACTQAITHAAAAAEAKGYTISRIGISAAMHSLIAVDANQQPLTNALIWMDSRAATQANRIWETERGKAIYERTGTPVHPMAPLAKICWLRETHPDLFQKATRFVSLKEWVWYQWFNEWQIDASMASATGLYCLAENDWDSDALALAGIRPDHLSTLVPTTFTRAGIRDTQLRSAGIGAQTTATIGASDGVLANLGVGALDPSVMTLTLGTSGAVRHTGNTIMTDRASRIFCYVLDTQTQRYVTGAPSNSGGIVLDWLYHMILTKLGGDPSEEAFTDLINDAGHVSSDGVICLPYITGERAPLWNPEATAAFIGLRQRHTPAQMLRAAVEGILCNTYWMATTVWAKTGKPREIIASGKVLETEWVRQVTADIFGVPVRFTGNVDASTLGATLISDIAGGIYQWEEAGQRGEPSRTDTLDPQQHGYYQDLYGRFRHYADALLSGR